MRPSPPRSGSAARAYQGYLNSHPNDKLAELELGFALQAAGNLNKAAAAWEKTGQTAGEFVSTGQQALSGGDSARAEVWFQRALAMSPDDGLIWYELAQIYKLSGDTAEAEKLLTKSVELKYLPSVSDLQNLYTYQNRSADITRLLKFALEQFPNSAERFDWWNMLANNLLEARDITEAVQVYQTAIVEFPNDLELHLDYVQTNYQLTSDAQFAIAQLSDLEKKFPNDGRLWYEEGLIYEEKGNWQNALELFQQATLKPRFTGSGISSVYYYIGRIYQENLPNTNLERIKTSFVRAIALDDFRSPKENADAHHRLGIIMRQLGVDPKVYINEFIRAVELNPLHTNAHILLGITYYDAYTDLKKAEEELLLAIGISPENKWGYYELGEIYRKVGEVTKAINMYKRAIDIDPDFEQARRELQLLQEDQD